MLYEILQSITLLIILILLIKPLGHHMAKVYETKPTFLDFIIQPFEHWLYRTLKITPNKEMNWREYTAAFLMFGLVNMIVLYLIQRIQAVLPLNPQDFANVRPDLAFNTSISFVTNTNWQAYSGESSLSYFTQMTGLTVQNFISAATGMAVLMAFIRGIVRQETELLGNFWVDVMRGILYILMPLAIILALGLVSQGVLQNFKAYQKAELIEVLQTKDTVISEQIIPMGPVASQVAIKQLGTNGGGFFNANAAHPFENPNAISNFLSMLAILLIPTALCYTFGVMVQNVAQGLSILIAMFVIFIPLALICIGAELTLNPLFMKIMNAGEAFSFPQLGNLEGKEVRFGTINSSLWAAATTATANGSINSMFDSFMPIARLIPLWLMDLGEVVFGGAGSGLYQMILFVIITVFIAGLMVGRTPEFLGKKIETFEMKMASVALLAMPLTVLIGTSIALMIEKGKTPMIHSAAYSFTEILYAFSSLTNNNGSSLAGLNTNTPFYNTIGGIAMLIGRYWIAIPVLAIAGSLAQKKTIPVGLGSLPTSTPLFVVLLVLVVLSMGGLIFFPSFALGPIAEQLMMLRY